jgi:hypothetical protein
MRRSADPELVTVASELLMIESQGGSQPLEVIALRQIPNAPYKLSMFFPRLLFRT